MAEGGGIVSTRRYNDIGTGAAVGIIVLWLLGVLLSLTLTGVIIWGIIKVVGAIT